MQSASVTQPGLLMAAKSIGNPVRLIILTTHRDLWPELFCINSDAIWGANPRALGSAA